MDYFINRPLDIQLTKRKSITDCLNLPDQPQRKNKRSIERISYSITSRVYQETFKAK